MCCIAMKPAEMHHGKPITMWNAVTWICCTRYGFFKKNKMGVGVGGMGAADFFFSFFIMLQSLYMVVARKVDFFLLSGVYR